MAKPKSPILSLGAKGTIANTLTYQKRGQDTIARKKPIPAYRYTLPQAYQRWLYEDYAYLWTQQSEATKRTYAVSGSRFHLTGFQYWMKYQLTNLPDIAGMWHLDTITNSKTPDFSKNANHGTVYGSSIVDGLIDKALSFDGLDDRVTIPAHSAYTITGPFTICLFLKPAKLNTPQYILDARSANDTDFFAGLWNTNRFRLSAFGLTTTFLYSTRILTPADLNTWLHLAFQYDASHLRIFINGSQDISTPATGSINATLAPIRLAAAHALGFYLGGTLDHLIIYNRALDATEIKQHSERRYPV